MNSKDKAQAFRALLDQYNGNEHAVCRLPASP